MANEATWTAIIKDWWEWNKNLESFDKKKRNRNART